MADLPQNSAPLIADWNKVDAWSTACVAPHQQFDRWREFVVDAHLRWDIRRFRCDQFPAYIRQGRFQGHRMTHITSRVGGIVGDRGRAQIAGDDEALYNLIYIAEGSITLEIGDEPIVLSAGSFALWDSTRRMRFITGEHLRQITLAVPHAVLQRALPGADDYVGLRLEVGASDISRLFIDHLLSLDNTFGALPRGAAAPVLHSTVELLATTLSASVGRAGEDSGSVLLQRILDFIARNLDEPALTTERIAEAHHISRRHLHRLFVAIESSPATWIRQQRLDRCRKELISEPRLSITDIAYRWGFGDSGAFGKICRKEFGMSPSELRKAGPLPVATVPLRRQ